MALTHQQSVVDNATLTGIANAIRTKGGTTAALKTTEMADAINNIPDGVEKQSWLNDGNIHIWLKFKSPRKSIVLNGELTATGGAGSNITISWGDGTTSTNTASTSGLVNLADYDHSYTGSASAYRIDISGVSNFLSKGNSLFASNDFGNGQVWSSGAVVQFECGCPCSFLRIANTYNPFQGCFNLQWMKVNLAALNSYSFSELYGLRSLELVNPITVASIPDYCFNNLNMVTSLDLDKITGYTSIGSSSFAHCSCMTRYDLAEGLTTIGTNAFATPVSLEYISIPSTITSLSSTYMFRFVYVKKQYPATRTLQIKATNPPTLESGILGYFTKIIVPTGCLNSYKTATNWSAYANIMEEASA